MIPTRSAVPIFAAVLLLLPLLYVGSYLSLVVPGGDYLEPTAGAWADVRFYRAGEGLSEWFFWPLEQIDRMVRQERWDNGPYPTPK